MYALVSKQQFIINWDRVSDSMFDAYLQATAEFFSQLEAMDTPEQKVQVIEGLNRNLMNLSKLASIYPKLLSKAENDYTESAQLA